ncbi:MAG: M35 family metallo-endopeptidase [Pseudomonadota bacterium]
MVARRVWVVLCACLCTLAPIRALADWAVSLVAAGDGRVAVTLENRGAHDAWVRVPGSLLDTALPEHLFVLSPVVRDDSTGGVSYAGPVVKRVPAGAGDYLRIDAGERLERVHDLRAHYRIPAAGGYRVQLIQHLHTLDLAPEAGEGARLAQREQVAWLRSNTLDIVLPQDLAKTRLRTPDYQGCDASQQSLVLSAAQSAESLVGVAVTDLASLSPERQLNSPRYRQWFGPHSSVRFTTALQNLRNVQKVLREDTVRYNCGCDIAGVYAFVRADLPYDITLCPAFWSTTTVGTDSRAGTIVHELSHFRIVAGTSDHAYGQQSAATLANLNPVLAVDNADNHEYFVENTPDLSILSPSLPPPADAVFGQLEPDGQVSGTIVLGERRFYTVDSVTRISLQVEADDTDLLVYADRQLAKRLCAHTTERPGTEQCAPGVAGAVFIEVRGTLGDAFRLTTETATVGRDLTTLEAGQGVQSDVRISASQAYRVEGFNTVALTSSAGNADLYILRDPTDLQTAVCSATGASPTETCSLPDTYNVLFPLVVGVSDARYELSASTARVTPSGNGGASGGGSVGGLWVALLALAAGRTRRRRWASICRAALCLPLIAASVAGCAQPETRRGTGTATGGGVVVVLAASERSPSTVRFGVLNASTEPVGVPMFGTPFETPILGDYFDVVSAGEARRYTGPLAKRDLTAGPVIPLGVGERKTVEIDLATLYNWPASGRVRVRFRPGERDGVLWLGQRLAIADAGGTVELTLP